MDAAPNESEPLNAPEQLEEILAHAHETHVVVVGGGIAGMVAALECGKVGIRVTLVEASDQLGGVIRSAEVAGVRVDLAAEGYSTKGGHVRALVVEVGLGDHVVSPDQAAVWLAGTASGPVPAPGESVLGIPENAWAERVRALIGWRGAWRAYVDRLRPPLTIGQQRSLGRLVRTRMGERVLEKLVAPLSLGAFAIHPDDVDVDIAAPGLSAALTRTGSLAGAVAQVRADRSTARGAGGALEGIDGGMSRLVDALHEKLLALGVEVHVDTAATEIVARNDGGWDVALEGETTTMLTADAVIVATPEVAARRLLAPLAPPLAAEPLPTVDLEVVTLVVTAPGLSTPPRRTAVYPLPGVSPASAVTVPTARWGWLRGNAESDTHVIRVTFGGPVSGRADAAPATATIDDTGVTAMALAAASTLLGVPLDERHLRGFHRERYLQSRPASALTHSSDTAAVRAALSAHPHIAVVGAWVAGTGLAQVVPDAANEADRVRRSVLWGEGGESA